MTPELDSGEGRSTSACAVPERVHHHEVVALDDEVERVTRTREAYLPHRLPLDLSPYLRERRHLREEVERERELVFEEVGRGGTVRAPPRRCGLGLLGRVFGELDAKGRRRQCRVRILASTSSAGTPVPGTCFRIDSARKP